MTDLCQKQGIVTMLVDLPDRKVTVLIPTTCRTYKCKPCSRRKKWLIGTKAQLGVSRLMESAPCVFTTCTFALTDRYPLRDAKSVQAVWRRYLQELSRQHLLTPWMRVLELTKRRQPHLHLIQGLPRGFGLGGREVNCESRPRYDIDWVKKDCDCLEHTLSYYWWRSSGDSWVVDCGQILSAQGAGRYASKYIAKDLASPRSVASVGFKRRYSNSADWPVGEVWCVGRELGWHTAGWSSAVGVIPVEELNGWEGDHLSEDGNLREAMLWLTGDNVRLEIIKDAVASKFERRIENAEGNFASTRCEYGDSDYGHSCGP